MKRGRTGPCACCGQEDEIRARNLIVHCYERVMRDGNLSDWPRQTVSFEDFAADYKMLRAEGYNHRQIAERLGYRLNSMRRQITRARKRGLLPAPAGA